jgi:nondiscriminating glutamyl-tRNA synthetase
VSTTPSTRVRFAPSPTGHLHVGGARSALYNFLFAKKMHGSFVLRVEDTDLERSTNEFMASQIESLNLLGLDFNEGVDPKTLKDFGSFGPYRQSVRMANGIYKREAETLLKLGKAFYCFEPADEKQTSSTTRFLSPDRNKSLAEAEKRIAAGEKPVIRFKAPEHSKVYKFNDLIRGPIEFNSDMIGDFVILRSNGMPVYNFCCVVDDHQMLISDVLRAEEHLSNSLRQLMIYEGFNWEPPRFGHISLILGPDKQKLSKRHGATSVTEFIERGFLPEAIINYLSLLGWTHPEEKEIFDLKELVEKFDLQKVHASPAVFDEVKLKWVNAQHLRALDVDDFTKRVSYFLKKEGYEINADKAWWAKAFELFKPKVETLVEAAQMLKLVSTNGFTIGAESAEALSWDTTKKTLETWKSFLNSQSSDYMSDQKFVEAQEFVKTTAGVKGKQLFMPLRVAIIGVPQGAEINGLVPLLSKTELLRRVDKALGAAK